MRNEKANEQKFEIQLHILQILLSINNMNFNNMNDSENVLMDVSHKLLYVEKEVVRKGNRFPLVGMRGYLRYMKFKRKGLKYMIFFIPRKFVSFYLGMSREEYENT